MRLRDAVVGVGLTCLVACGAKHPPYIGDAPTSRGGGSNGADTSAAGDAAIAQPGGMGVGSGSTGGPATGKDGVVLPDRHGVLDSKQVYFAGLSKDAVQLGDLFKSEYVFSPVLDPSTYYFAFSDQPHGVIVGDELLYGNDADIYRYVSDVPQRGHPEGNDTLVPTPGCDADQQVIGLLGSPEGRLLYSCENQGLKLWEGDQVVYEGDEGVRALGYGDLALIGPGKFGNATTESGLNLLTLDDGMPAPVSGLPDQFAVLAVRAQPDGFSVALRIGDVAPVELWRISADGTATKVGTYPAPPDDFDEYTLAMAADEVCYLLGSSGGVNVIVKSSVAGDATIIYREPADAQLLMGDRGQLVSVISGP